MNATIEKFGYPGTCIAEFDHWVVLLRQAQPTLGALILAAKSDAEAFGDLDPAAHAELALVTRTIEAALKRAVQYDRINYLMLMMVDPHVHFHVLPRYDGAREAAGLSLTDTGWPKTPDLGNAVALDPDQTAALVAWVQSHWS